MLEVGGTALDLGVTALELGPHRCVQLDPTFCRCWQNLPRSVHNSQYSVKARETASHIPNPMTWPLILSKFSPDISPMMLADYAWYPAHTLWFRYQIWPLVTLSFLLANICWQTVTGLRTQSTVSMPRSRGSISMNESLRRSISHVYAMEIDLASRRRQTTVLKVPQTVNHPAL